MVDQTGRHGSLHPATHADDRECYCGKRFYAFDGDVTEQWAEHRARASSAGAVTP